MAKDIGILRSSAGGGIKSLGRDPFTQKCLFRTTRREATYPTVLVEANLADIHQTLL